MNKYICAVTENDLPIGYYSYEAENRDEATEIGIATFNKEFHMSYRWSERGSLWNVAMVVKEVKESRFMPGVFTDWENG